MTLRHLAGLWALVGAASPLQSQSLLTGRVHHAPSGQATPVPLPNVLCVAAPEGEAGEPRAFRSWEMEPAGWFRLSVGAGAHTLFFTQPGGLMRPVIRNHVFSRAGEQVDGFRIEPRFALAVMSEQAWDLRPAHAYYQPFVASGTAVTQVGFRLAHDGVDGAGPGTQTLLVSIHRRAAGTPHAWPQVGPTVPVLRVDAGGPKNYSWAAGWNSGEAPLIPGETYAVCLRAERADSGFQAFWTPAAEPAGCFRIGADGTRGFVGQALWLTVATDGDGLLIPFNKRVQAAFGEFAGMAATWSQTWIAQGRSLAAVTVHAAVSGAQPPLSRQRLRVRVREGRVREGGVDGPLVGGTKIAIGNGNYTGDASWGVFTTAFRPGEVPLQPGRTYSLELESIERMETLHGFVNIKGQVSDDRAGFNPYRKTAPDQYQGGTAFKNGHDEMAFDLDVQIVEYEFAPHAPSGPPLADPNLLLNGDMESESGGLPGDWKGFTSHADTVLSRAHDQELPENAIARVAAPPGKAASGGFVQRVNGLHRLETYQLRARVRSSWPLDFEHRTQVGIDPTGQDSDADATTIEWADLPVRHGEWFEHRATPVRPRADSISVWLRGRSTWTHDTFAPFKAEFDAVELRQVETAVPTQPPR